VRKRIVRLYVEGWFEVEEFVVGCGSSSMMKIGQGPEFPGKDQLLPPRKDPNLDLLNNL
jgi:hypothetical protein